ncbi:hypothetical protein HK105_205839 [Polyrhizophydium stewartii]|uniref:Uncharacterized protein n=1 Tax=Polyrhizophydium stewartii TaxID=2732419 RepID=A0ABR4N5F1_9FUNG
MSQGRIAKVLTSIVKWSVLTVGLGVVIVGSGYGIMKATVPSDEEMVKRIGTIDQDHLDDVRRKNKLIIEAIIANSKSDKPVWNAPTVEDIDKAAAAESRRGKA